MDVNIIPYQTVKASIVAAKATGKLETGKYNTNAHSYESIQSVVPRSPDSVLIHQMPDMTVEHLTNWVDLIMSTRREDPANVHVFHLPPVLVTEILAAVNFWAFRKRELQEMDEFISMFPRFTAVGVRLDFFSAKDREASISSGVSNAGRRANLFLLPFNHDIDPARGYRVFVPPSESVLLVSAISQYRWHRPFYETDRSAAMCRAKEVYEGTIKISEVILEHAETLPQQVQDTMQREGLVFDVFQTSDVDVQLMEISPFGGHERLWNELDALDQRREIVVRRMPQGRISPIDGIDSLSPLA
ncbi:hypothetical protein DFS33DRAFT_1417750 [Desarmillaria ectypa]|nr:hypothetical protein DFS33DRAFT_1417750 [Desarmillaria ectypa]